MSLEKSSRVKPVAATSAGATSRWMLAETVYFLLKKAFGHPIAVPNAAASAPATPSSCVQLCSAGVACAASILPLAFSYEPRCSVYLCMRVPPAIGSPVTLTPATEPLNSRAHVLDALRCVQTALVAAASYAAIDGAEPAGTCSVNSIWNDVSSETRSTGLKPVSETTTFSTCMVVSWASASS